MTSGRKGPQTEGGTRRGTSIAVERVLAGFSTCGEVTGRDLLWGESDF